MFRGKAVIPPLDREIQSGRSFVFSLIHFDIGSIMIEKAFADQFAADWIESWNQRDLDRILSHYTDDFEMSSPLIIRVAGEPSGTLKGKEAVRTYWAKALQSAPNLRFDLVETLVGVNSITLYYNGVRGPAAEVFHFDRDGKITKAYAHYL
jgi:hypothetical protein